MTRDDIKKILGENASEEQITNLLDSFHKSNKETKNQIETLNEKLTSYSDYDDIKAKLDNYEREKMTTQEKIELAEKQANENLMKSKIILNTTKAKEILAGLDLDDDTISMLVSDDETKTINNANKLKAKFDSVKEIVTKQTTETLMKADLKPTMTNVPQSDDVMTFEKFGKLSAEEQEKFITEHPQEFEKL